MKFLFRIFLLFVSSCAYLGKESHVAFDLNSRKDVTPACPGRDMQTGFYTQLGEDKILINLRLQPEQAWLGPVFVPMFPTFGDRLWVYISSHKNKSEAATYAQWKLIVDGQTLSPKEVLHDGEDRFGFRTFTTLVFADAKVAKAQNFELQMLQGRITKKINITTAKKWFYMPFAGMLYRPYAEFCGEYVEPKFFREAPEIGKALVYFYRAADDKVGTARAPDVLLNDKILFEAKHAYYKKLQLAPGAYKLQIRGIDLGSPDLEFVVESNKTYFLRYSATGDVKKQLFFADEATGLKEIIKTKDLD